MNFEVESRPECLVIHCNVDLSANSLREIHELLNQAQWRKAIGSATAVAFDFHGTSQLNSQNLGEIGALAERLPFPKSRVFLLNVPLSVRESIKKAAIGTSVVPVESSNDLVSRLDSPELSQNATLIKASSESVLEMLKTQCPMMQIKLLNPFSKQLGSALSVDIGSILGIKSPKHSGMIALAFPGDVFVGIMGSIHGERYTSLSPDLEDGAGELLNMLRSSLRGRLPNGIVVDKDVPSTVQGAVLEKLLRSNQHVIVVPVSTDYGDFYLEIGLSPLFKS